MADDLMRSRQLNGLTKEQVRELLGRPSNRYSGKCWYVLGGPPSTFGGITNLLVVEFEPDGNTVGRAFRSTG